MMKFGHVLSISLLWSGLSYAEPGKGLLGFRYNEQREGLVITKVVAGSGAEAAGVGVGDRIVGIDGVDILESDERPALKGAVNSTVQLDIIPALSMEAKSVSVKRGKKRAKAKEEEPRSPKVISRFSGAMYNGKPREIKTATQALVDADFGGQDPDKAIGRHLVRAIKKKRKKAVRAALSILTAVPEPSPGLQYRIGQAYFVMGDDHATAAKWLGSLLESYPQDVARSLGTRGREEEWLANSLWLSGDRDGAIALTRDLVRRRQVDFLLQRVGMANPAPVDSWSIALPPVAEVDVDLLDGSDWTLSSHRGKPVVLVFWASWCGPCKQELPALAELRRERPDWPVEFLAVSTDRDSAAGKVDKLVKGWDLPFPVTRTEALNDRFDVSGLPSMRIIGPNGSLRSSSRGYSKSSVKKLVSRLEELVAEGDNPGKEKMNFPYAVAWGAKQPVVRSIYANEEIRRIAASGSGVAVEVRTHGALMAPSASNAIGGTLEVEETQKSSGDKGVAWFGGPTSHGINWIRSRKEDGETAWFLTTPSRIRGIASSGDQLWVALKDGLLALDASGGVVHNLDVSVRDIAPADDGGIWAVDGQERLRIGPDGSALLRDEALGSRQIAADGTWASDGIDELIAGRFGPDGSTRVIGLNDRGTIVGLDGNGVAALRIKVEGDKIPSLAHADLDGDGQDELLISTWGLGVATVEVEIP